MEDLGYNSSSESSTYSEFVVDPPGKRHRCTEIGCNKSFFRPSKLADHLRSHSNEKPFVCNFENCEKAYHKKDALKKHQNRVHLKQIERTLCPVEGCLKEIQVANLKKHILRKHNKFRRYKFNCMECQSGFCKETQLNNHITEHIPIYTCDMCQKVFEKGHRFRAHVKNHKKYECICKEVFYLRTKLTNHKKTCEFMKLRCQICDVTFTTRFNYLQHTSHCHIDKKHMEKFKCDFEGCMKEYNYKKNLNMHQQKNHLGKTENEANRWTCRTCGKSFKTKEYMRKHSKKFHLNPEPKKNKLRKQRFDKGIAKIPMITKLTGIEITKEENRNRIKMESQNNAGSVKKVMSCNDYLPEKIEDSSSVQSDGDSSFYSKKCLKMETEVDLECFKGSADNIEKFPVIVDEKCPTGHPEENLTAQTEESSQRT